MKKSYVFLAPGFEETEAIGTVDVMRRAGMEVLTAAVSDQLEVTSSHGVTIKADVLLSNVDFEESDWLILPGGLPGANNLRDCKVLTDALQAHFAAGRHVAAICASPGAVLAPLCILDNLKATSYPGFDKALKHPVPDVLVVTDANVVTGKGPAAVYQFGLAIVAKTLGQEKADEVAKGMLLK